MTWVPTMRKLVLAWAVPSAPIVANLPKLPLASLKKTLPVTGLVEVTFAVKVTLVPFGTLTADAGTVTLLGAGPPAPEPVPPPVPPPVPTEAVLPPPPPQPSARLTWQTKPSERAADQRRRPPGKRSNSKQAMPVKALTNHRVPRSTGTNEAI